MLTWGWSCTVVVLIVAGVIAAAPHSAAWVLLLLGLPALGIALTTLNMGYGRTVLTPEGLRTHRFVTRHYCPWTDVAGISTSRTETKRGRGAGTYRTNVIISQHTGKRFRLAAPYDTSNAHDPQFFETVNQIKAYYSQAAEQLAGRPGD